MVWGDFYKPKVKKIPSDDTFICIYVHSLFAVIRFLGLNPLRALLLNFCAVEYDMNYKKKVKHQNIIFGIIIL